MPEELQVYKCNICGNVVEVLHGGKGELVCCGEPMELLKEKYEEEDNEMHLPEIDRTERGFFLKIGLIRHPMQNSHHIEWVEVKMDDGTIHRKTLSPGDIPEVYFGLDHDDLIEVRVYCNTHELWKQNMR
ncbi:MAG: desulfoferrodoxin [Thermoplasmatota archaeon]